jgi:radical SAM superfamily enzyme YgiQ (UPF0313 family)
MSAPVVADDGPIAATAAKNLVVFIDPLEGEGERKEVEISIPGRERYSGSPVGIKDPIALQYIASYFEDRGFRTLVLLRGLMGNQGILQRIGRSKDEIVAVCIALHSTYLVPSGLVLAARIKELIPGVPIIVGGYHPTGDTDIVTEKVIDYAVIGEGEESCFDLISALHNGKGAAFIKTIPGLAFLDDGGEIFTTPKRPRLDFSALPWPKREREILELCRPGPLSYPPVGRVAQVAYSRGCPYGCPFCASPSMWERRVHYRDAGDMAAEMRHLITNYGINNFFFCDLSFNGNKKKLIELCESVKAMKHTVDAEFGSHVMCTSTIIDEVILGKMKESNFWKIDYGIEDILEGTISRIKTFQRVEKIRATLTVTNKTGILMRGLMMIGYPWETEDSIRMRESLIDQFPVDQLRLCFYTPFKGTAMYESVKDRIIVGLGGFTTDQPAIRCDGIGPDQLMAAIPRLLKKFYNSDNYIQTFTRKCREFPELADAYYHFYNYLHKKELLSDDSHAHFMDVTRIRTRTSNVKSMPRAPIETPAAVYAARPN